MELKYWDNSCNGCPIYFKTGYTGCEESPYVDYFKLSNDYKNETKSVDSKLVQVHLKMITWMKDLYKECVVEKCH